MIPGGTSAERVHSSGGAIKLARVTARLNDLLVITKLLNVFECFETEDEAIDSFGGRVAAE
jgi:hypothetical protein